MRLRALGGIDDQQHAIDHLHDALDLAAEVGVAGGIDDVDGVAAPVDRGVLGLDGDALFAFEVHRVHGALGDAWLARKVPPACSSWSTRVVLPWSTWAMMAIFRILMLMGSKGRTLYAVSPETQQVCGAGAVAGELPAAAPQVAEASAPVFGARGRGGRGGIELLCGHAGVFRKRDRGADDLLDLPHVLPLVGGGEGDGVAGLSGAACPPDAVDVVFGVVREVEVDHQFDACDVDAACGDIGGDKNPVLAGLESAQGFLPLRQGSVGVDFCCVMAHLPE